MLFEHVLVLLALCTVCTIGINLPKPVQYLSQYGYLPKLANTSQLLGEKVFKTAISAFQRMAEIPITGKWDQLTQDAMKLPRCGLTDAGGPQKFVLQGKWEKKQLTYKVVQYSSKLRKEDVDRELAKAFGIWQKNSALSFRAVSVTQPADIEVRFTSQGIHNARFDGPGGTLAYAFFPQNGDIYFDESEPWNGGKTGISLFHVALHELGHSLGLGHSNVKRAVMYPFYKNTYQDLEADDVSGIQKLYGSRQQTNATPRTTTTTTRRPITRRRPNNPKRRPQNPVFPQDPILCKYPSIDAALRTRDGTMYIFKDDNFWQLTNNGLSKNYPRKIAHYWPGLPSNIDAAFVYHRKTYFFKGLQFYVFMGYKMLPGYPKYIATNFGGLPGYIDAATNWAGRSTVYFFKGSHIYSFDFRTKRTSIISRSFSLNGVQAVLQHKNKKTYFFKNNFVYRSDDISYPFSYATSLFKCKSYGQSKLKKPNKEQSKKVPFQIPKKTGKKT